MSDVIEEGMTSEQLLLICASAVEQNNVGAVEQAASALQKMSSINGEPSERVTAYFLQAILRRGSSMLDSSFSSGSHDLPTSHGKPMSNINASNPTSFISPRSIIPMIVTTSLNNIY